MHILVASRATRRVPVAVLWHFGRRICTILGRLTRSFGKWRNQRRGFGFVFCAGVSRFHARESNPLDKHPTAWAIVLGPKERFWWEMIQEQLLVLIFWDSVSLRPRLAFNSLNSPGLVSNTWLQVLGLRAWTSKSEAVKEQGWLLLLFCLGQQLFYRTGA